MTRRAHTRAKIFEHAIGIDNQREYGGVTQSGMNKCIRDALVFGRIHKDFGLVEMALDLPVRHGRQKLDVGELPGAMADTLPEGFILNRTNHPTARLRQAFREIEEEMRTLYAMATCHPEKVDVLLLGP